jgi:DNA-binding transcriptional LysR family regulator
VKTRGCGWQRGSLRHGKAHQPREDSRIRHKEIRQELLDRPAARHNKRAVRADPWFPRRANPAFYDRMMLECYRGGLKSPRIVQEGVNEPTILSLVSTGMGVGWVLATARWRCPDSVLILPVVDLNMPLTLVLVWKRDNTSPLLANFIAEVRRLPDVRAVNKG